MRYLIISLLVILALLQYRLWFSPGGRADVDKLEETRQDLVDENEHLKERNDSLAAEVIDLQHGVEAVEERARSEMGMIKSGEVFYQIIDDPDQSPRELPIEVSLEEPDAAP